METKPKEPINPPLPYYGVACIEYLANYIALFIQQNRNRQTASANFKTIFKDDAEHLIAKDWQKNFGGFFLNLDNKNTVAFLKHITKGKADLTFPSIPDWQGIGARYGMDKWESFTEEDVRNIAMVHLSPWDCYPHDIVWIRKFILYAENNGIEDENWTGEKFGNLRNWTVYYRSMLTQKKIDFCKFLIKYS